VGAAILFSLPRDPWRPSCFLQLLPVNFVSCERRVIKRNEGEKSGLLAAGLFIYPRQFTVMNVVPQPSTVFVSTSCCTVLLLPLAQNLNFYIFLKIFISDGLTMCLKTEKYR
jgi:hypothetical protein